MVGGIGILPRLTCSPLARTPTTSTVSASVGAAPAAGAGVACHASPGFVLEVARIGAIAQCDAVALQPVPLGELGALLPAHGSTLQLIVLGGGGCGGRLGRCCSLLQRHVALVLGVLAGEDLSALLATAPLSRMRALLVPSPLGTVS